MEDWLKERLTPAKGKEARWTDLAEVLQSIWAEVFDPPLSRLERLRSSYQADLADLIRKMREMGDYFSFDLPTEVDRQVVLPWRRLELDYKEMEDILGLAFKRHFGKIDARWLPLFAPMDQQAHPYGALFEPSGPERSDAQKNIPPDGWFLTSRGVLGANVASLMAKGISKREFVGYALPLLRRVKPLHIVFDGAYYFYRATMPFEATIAELYREIERWNSMPFGVVGAQYDITPADVRFTDLDSMKVERVTERHDFCIFLGIEGMQWRLDWTFPLDLVNPLDLPLDILIEGVEGDKKFFEPLVRCTERSSTIATTTKDYARFQNMWHGTERTAPAIHVFDLGRINTGELTRERTAQAEYGTPPFPSAFPYALYDICPADMFPTDMPLAS